MNRITRNLWTLTAIAGLVFGVGFAASTASAAIVGPFSTTVDFDVSGDLGDFTHVSNGSSTVSYTSDPGADGANGHIAFGPNGTDDSIFYYTPAAHSGGLIQLQHATDSATVGWDFEATDATHNFVPRVGFRGDTTTTSGSGDDIYTLARFSGSGNYSMTLRNYVNGGLNDNVNDSDLFAFTEDDWYRMQLTLTKNATSGELGLETVLYSLTPGGDVDSTIDTFTQTFTNSDLYNDGFYAYFEFQSDTTGQFSKAADNFSLDITAIPEPTSLALLVLGVTALLGRRRRRR